MVHYRRIQVMCDDCARVRVRADRVTVRTCVDTDRWSYRFVCPRCHQMNVAPTSERAGLAATAAGATFEVWWLPLEVHERRSGPPLTLTDLFNLVAGLDEPDWFDELRADRLMLDDERHLHDQEP